MAKSNQGPVGTGADFAPAIAEAERLSQTLLSIDIRFKTISDSLAKVSGDMSKAFDGKSIATANTQVDRFLKGLKEVEKLSSKLELVLKLKGMDEIDRAYTKSKEVTKEFTKLKAVLDDVGLDAFEDMFKNIDVSKLPDSTQKAIKKMQDEFVDIDLVMPELEFSILPPKFVLPPMEPFGEEIQDFFRNLDIELKPKLNVGNDFVTEELEKQKAADKKTGDYQKFIKQSLADKNGPAKLEQAYKGLGEDDQRLFEKSWQLHSESSKTKTAKAETKETKEETAKEKSPLRGVMDMLKMKPKTQDFAEEALGKVYMPKIPGMGNKSMGEAMGSPAAMAGVGIQAVVEILSKIFQIISEASGFMKAILKMINITIQMFFRPIGDMLGRFLMPYIRIMMVRTAQNYAKWAQGGFKPSEFGNLMADNATVMLEGVGAIIFDAMVKITFMQLKGIMTIMAWVDKAIVWGVGEYLKLVIASITMTIKWLGTFILTAIKVVGDKIFEIIKNVITTIFNVARFIVNGFFDVIIAAIYPVVALLDKVVNAVNGQGKDPEMRKTFKDSVNSARNGVIGVLNTTESGMITAINGLQAAFDKSIDSSISSLKTTMDNLRTEWTNKVDNAVKGINAFLDTQLKGMTDLLTKMEAQIPSALDWFSKQGASLTKISETSTKQLAATGTESAKKVAAIAGQTTTLSTTTSKASGVVNTSIQSTIKAASDNTNKVTKGVADVGKGIVSAVGKVTEAVKSLNATAESKTTTTTTGGFTKTQEQEAYNYAVETMGHTTAYFNSREAAGLAGGGYVKGPTPAIIGEGRDPREVVLPMEAGAKVLAKEITNILGNSKGDTRPNLTVHVEVKGPVYGIDDFERKFDQLMKKEMAKWSWR